MPILLNNSVELLGCINPRTVGPNTMPTTIWPTTSGSPVFRQIAPDSMVRTRIAHNVATNTAISEPSLFGSWTFRALASNCFHTTA